MMHMMHLMREGANGKRLVNRRIGLVVEVGVATPPSPGKTMRSVASAAKASRAGICQQGRVDPVKPLLGIPGYPDGYRWVTSVN